MTPPGFRWYFYTPWRLNPGGVIGLKPSLCDGFSLHMVSAKGWDQGFLGLCFILELGKPSFKIKHSPKVRGLCNLSVKTERLNNEAIIVRQWWLHCQQSLSKSDIGFRAVFWRSLLTVSDVGFDRVLAQALVVFILLFFCGETVK